MGLAAGERLAAHWMRPGFERLPQHEGRLPVLYFLTDSASVHNKLASANVYVGRDAADET